ncbi:hypothetical protein LDL77_19245 [Flagellimonas marinaquae]|nr:hypothetical protein LDL77_19245 [Allomuricauda aquimarina]
MNTATDALSADVIAYNNFYPFGMPQPNRNFDSQEYTGTASKDRRRIPS